MYVIHTNPSERTPTSSQKFLALMKGRNQEFTWTNSWALARTFSTKYEARNVIADINIEMPGVHLHISASLTLSKIIIDNLVAI